MPFIAQYSGTPCDACEERIREGQEVQYTAADRLVHVACPEVLDTSPGPLCPSCWMELPGTGVCGNCE